MTALALVLPVLAAGCCFAAVIVTLAPGGGRIVRAGVAIARPPVPHLALRAIRHRALRREAVALTSELPDVVDLLAVAAASGCNVLLAIEAVTANQRGPAAILLADALTAQAGGERLADALAAIPGSLDSAAADAMRPLVAVLVDSERYGTPLVPSLERVATDVRLHRQRRAEERARRTPVRLLLPLVLCVLPAFALLTVAPLLAGIARDALADQNPSEQLDEHKELP